MTATAEANSAAPARHVRKDSPIKGVLAKWYASNTGKSLDVFSRLARRVADELPQGSKVLEVAPGPGYFCIELAKLGPYSITGVDLSPTFVEIAASKAAAAGVKVEFKQGNASSLPLADDTFDFLLCRAAFKNFAQPVGALQEMCRVLKPEARGLLIDLNRDASPESIDHAVNDMDLNFANRMVTKLIFRTMLLRRAYSRQEFKQLLAQTGFRHVDIQEADIGFEISMTK